MSIVNLHDDANTSTNTSTITSILDYYIGSDDTRYPTIHRDISENYLQSKSESTEHSMFINHRNILNDSDEETFNYTTTNYKISKNRHDENKDDFTIDSDVTDVNRYECSRVLGTSLRVDDNGNIILSETLYERMKNDKVMHYSSIPTVKMGISLKRGTTGIYSRVIARTLTTDFGLVEETRVIVAFGLYCRWLCLYLCPIITVNDEGVATYDKRDVIRLVLYDAIAGASIWIRVVKTGVYIRGCNFQANAPLIGRTAIYNGSYIERDGKHIYQSCRGMMPKRFTPLFEDLANDDILVW